MWAVSRVFTQPSAEGKRFFVTGAQRNPGDIGKTWDSVSLARSREAESNLLAEVKQICIKALFRPQLDG